MSLSSEVLAEVREMGPASVAQIAAGIGRPNASVHRVLQRLVTEGLVVSDNYQLTERVYLAREEG